jgi:hypothetical protein
MFRIHWIPLLIDLPYKLSSRSTNKGFQKYVLINFKNTS